MAERRCLNCESAIAATARFCPHCSQRTDTARLSFADMTRDLMHAFVNVERGPLMFAWALLTRPGRIAREYIEGRRRRYYGPFATLAVLVGFAALALNLSGFQVLPTSLVRISHCTCPSPPVVSKLPPKRTCTSFSFATGTASGFICSAPSCR